MAVSVIPLDCDIKCTSANKNGIGQTHKWSDEKLKSLWSSLLNLEIVSKCNEDVELQGVLLLLETTFSVFKNMNNRYKEAESAYQTVKHDLESSTEDLCRVKEALKCHKREQCERCPELERELGVHRKKLKYNESCIKSILSILSINNNSGDLGRNQSSQKSAIYKAYNLASQMVVENDSSNSEKDTVCDVRTETKRLRHNSTERSQMRTPGKRRKKQNKRAAKADVLNMKDRESDTDTLYYGATLAPESIPANDRVVCPGVGKEIVPETFCSQYPAKFSDIEKSVSQVSVVDVKERVDNIHTTPKKQILQEKVTQKHSPILGGSSRKSIPKTAHCDYSVIIVDSPNNSAVPLQTLVPNGKSDTCVSASGLINNCKDYANTSPSLLKIQPGIPNSVATSPYKMDGDSQERKGNEKHEQNISRPLEGNRVNIRNNQADFWKLKPIPSVNINDRNPLDVVNRKLKQTTLSVHSFSRKQDLCTLKEFNGGVRLGAFESSSLVDQINGDCDEETSLTLAIQESLNEKENVESVSSESRSPGVRNERIGSPGDDDDIVLTSPNASSCRTSPRQKCVYTRVRPSVRRTGDIASQNAAQKKKQLQPAVRRKDMDETLFVPLYTSTLQDGTYDTREIKRVPKTEELSSEQTIKKTVHPAEVKNRMESELVKKHNCSFDRVPEKVSTSPNYKYRRNALRKREARQKLDGWECEQCKNYYAVTNGGADPTVMKRHLKQCSRHRDKYSVHSSTPKGFWDMNFSDTEESKLEDTLTSKTIPFPKD